MKSASECHPPLADILSILTKSSYAVVPAPWHFLYFLPEPHGHGSLRPTFFLGDATTLGSLPCTGSVLARRHSLRMTTQSAILSGAAAMSVSRSCTSFSPRAMSASSSIPLIAAAVSTSASSSFFQAAGPSATAFSKPSIHSSQRISPLRVSTENNGLYVNRRGVPTPIGELNY